MKELEEKITTRFKTEDILRFKNTILSTQLTLKRENRQAEVLRFVDKIKYRYKEKDFSKHLSAPTIATATTSHGRFWLLIHIYYITNTLRKNVYYADTDSIFTDAILESSNELGDLKLEKHIEKAYFLAPKTYIYTTEDTTSIKAKGTGKRLIREYVLQSLKTPFTIQKKQAIADDRKTIKIPDKDGWLYYIQEPVDYFEAYKHILEKALQEIEDTSTREELYKILKAAIEEPEEDTEAEPETEEEAKKILQEAEETDKEIEEA
jgi:hypothetical protein